MFQFEIQFHYLQKFFKLPNAKEIFGKFFDQSFDINSI